MITFFLISLTVVAVSLMLAGYMLAHRTEPQPQFARITNGASLPDALKSHRAR